MLYDAFWHASLTLYHISLDSIRFMGSLLRPKSALAAENLFLRKQLALYQEREVRPRRATDATRLSMVLTARLFDWKEALISVRPETFTGWHHRRFKLFWRWKSRPKGGRPAISPDMRALIRRLSRENVLWSAETIYGHLVLLGFDPPCPDTIRKYMVKPTGGTDKSQTWLTFLRNHMPVSWAMDFFTVPTIRFQILYVFVVLSHSRRQVVHFGVTAHPTMAWVIQQLREATPFGLQPRYMFRDNDGIYGDEVSRFLKRTGIEEVKTAYRSPWQNPFLERYIGTIRRELLDHVIILE